MKRIIFFILLSSFFICEAQAQRSQICIAGVDVNDPNDWDVWGWDDWDDWDEDDFYYHYRHEVKRRRNDGRYRTTLGLFEMGFNGLREMGVDAYSAYSRSEKGFMDLDMGRSLGFNFNIATFGTRISKDNSFGISAAIGLSVNDYVFRESTRIGKVDGMFHPIATSDDLKKSKLNTVAIHVPVVLEVWPAHNFFIAAGAYADLMVGSHFKSKFPKEKLRNSYSNFFQAGLTARVGWRNIYAWGSYGLSDLFDDYRGPELRPFTVGIGIGF